MQIYAKHMLMQNFYLYMRIYKTVRALTLCSLRSLGGSQESTEQFGNVTADVIV